ncbi:hypothetical protein INN71_03900 [Nocardioides sp. ChNu-153]|uniref:hypothetical protein n=1 Tax=unclassified Nocardioides TaxID=2615069 RepID=UPI002405960B|nr:MULTISPECIES: hypothetical protein [unclassified Nocardioides]MDF9716599.1 hypothetical protein [Nocardioides sp. ChNu-99]MDN7120532.1 hypothetical protein [Nocardioides sp. ChNu-153]
MNRGSEDEAWRAIVENYGDRAEIDDDAWPADASGGPGSGRTASPVERPGEGPDERPDDLTDDLADLPGDLPDDVPAAPVRDPLEDRFVPPPPPPLPRPSPPRLLAWVGVLGMPALLVLTLLLGIVLWPVVSSFMVVWFLGGFAFLVASMPTQRVDGDGDDGAVV